MFRSIVIAFFSLTACLVVAYQVDAQQAPSTGAQPPGARGRGPSVPTLPLLFFKETWRIRVHLMRSLLARSSSPPKPRIQDVWAVRWTTLASGFHAVRRFWTPGHHASIPIDPGNVAHSDRVGHERSSTRRSQLPVKARSAILDHQRRQMVRLPTWRCGVARPSSV